MNGLKRRTRRLTDCQGIRTAIIPDRTDIRPAVGVKIARDPTVKRAKSATNDWLVSLANRNY